MQHPPRAAKEALFGRRTFAISILQGVSVVGVALVVFAATHYSASANDEARALRFTTLNQSTRRTRMDGTCLESGVCLMWEIKVIR